MKMIDNSIIFFLNYYIIPIILTRMNISYIPKLKRKISFYINCNIFDVLYIYSPFLSFFLRAEILKNPGIKFKKKG